MTASTTDADTSLRINFSVNAETRFGEQLLIVGNHSSLGLWDPSRAVRLYTNAANYPRWKASITVDDPSETALEYKYVSDARSLNGGFIWEPGENRSLKLPVGSRVGLSVKDHALGSAMRDLMYWSCDAEEAEEFEEAVKEVDDAATTAPSEVEADGTSEVSETLVACSNLPKTVSQGSEMERLASYSCLQLVEEPEDLLELRGQTEHVEDRPVRYGARHLGTPVVIVASELNPWSKTGGLGMVASSYAFEFALRGHRTMAIVPMYGEYANATCIGKAHIWLAGAEHEVQYFHQQQIYGPGKACDYIFVYHPSYRRAEGIYGPPGAEYGDNLFRFALLSLAAAEAPLVLNIGGSTYGDNVLFIANDWQTGLLPVYLCHKYKRHGIYQNARSIMVIHNIGYQGRYRLAANPIDSFLGLPHEAGADIQGEDMHYGLDCMNLLSAGIKKSDRVLTVSPSYATEIQSPEGGHGLHELLRWKASALRVAGILNGISDEWNPRIDKQIPCNYGIADFEEGKRVCKAALQKELGLHQDPDAVLIGFCGRLCYQKGITLILPNITWMMEGHLGKAQLIIMGKGDPDYSRDIAQMEQRFRHRVCGYVGFDPCVEHRMLAGCDILLMPSQYEPCGLPQMYAQQYGTLPIVHETGGLKDSVRGLWDEGRDKETATGFLFCGFNEHALREKLHHACGVFQHRRHIFKQMQSNAMHTNFSWPQAIDEYERHIDWTLEDPPFAG